MRTQSSSTGQGIGEPLRLPLFRRMWIANLISNLGWLIQGVAAAWLMTSLTDSADMVALVQTAVQAPIVLVSLFAGVAADLFDRRQVLLVAQLWMLANAVLLASLAGLGLLGPGLLLALTFTLGMGNALQGPAFQATIREIVPPSQLAAAVTLNAIAFNLARSVGPAFGGGIIAAAGVSTAFVVNALSYILLIGVLLTWRRTPRQDDLPRERLGGAIMAGLRYVTETRAISIAALRSSVFAFAASGSLALLPLVAKDVLGGGPVLFGVLLGAFGAGAMIGAFVIHSARNRFGSEWLVTVLSGVFAGSFLVLAFVPDQAAIMAALALAGLAWLGCFSSFNIAVQTSAAFWVQARVFAFYQMVMFGSMAAGAWIWGVVADQASLETALAGAGVVMLASLLLHNLAPLASGPGPDLRPIARKDEPIPAFPFDHQEGAVLIQVEYRIPEKEAPAFTAAMEEVGHLRKRNGAIQWQVFQDVHDAEHWIEAFTVPSWLDYRRQTRRMTTFDESVLKETRKHQLADVPIVVRRMVARRFEDNQHS